MSAPVSPPVGADLPVGVLRLRSRWTRRLGAVWFAAAAVWALADVVLIASGGGVTWDALAVPLLVGVAVVTRRAGLDVDDEGFVVHEGLRTHRVLWAAVERIDLDWSRRVDAPLRVHVAGDDRPLALHATWGLRLADRAALVTVLGRAAATHDIPIHTP